MRDLTHRTAVILDWVLRNHKNRFLKWYRKDGITDSAAAAWACFEAFDGWPIDDVHPPAGRVCAFTPEQFRQHHDLDVLCRGLASPALRLQVLECSDWLPGPGQVFLMAPRPIWSVLGGV